MISDNDINKIRKGETVTLIHSYREQIKTELQRLPVHYCKLMFGLLVWRTAENGFICRKTEINCSDDSVAVYLDTAAEYILEVSPEFDSAKH